MPDPSPQQAKARKAPSVWVALVPLVAMGLLLGIGYGVYAIKAQVLLIAAAVITGLTAWAVGLSWDEMQQGIVDSIRKALPAILIMLCVGLLVASWIACGTIPMVMSWGLGLISPRFFLATACLVCSVTALATGTSWGTIGTLGVAFIGIAQAQGIPLGPAAGAIVAGAYFGDKMSPFSDIPNLAPAATGANLYDTLRHMVWSAGPAWLLGLGFYLVIGLRYGGTGLAGGSVDTIRVTLGQAFTFSPVLLLPMLVVFAFAFAKKPVIPGMLLSVVVALVLALLYQKQSLVTLAQALNTGFKPATGVPEVDRLLARGGLMSMMETQLIAFAAFSFGGIMQKAGLLDVLLQRVLRLARRTGTLVLTTVGSCILTALVTGSSYLSVLVPGELLAPAFRARKLAAKNLSRLVIESGGTIVPLVPWSMASVYITGTIGVPTVAYAPWALMSWLSVLILVLFGFTGLTMAPRVRDDETAVGS
ncbi:MAG: Na+/H+ antiporter NhaC [Thermoanaerobaculaceae bacterium]|jgi:NhaC family Na+:H+ antiporter|nr:Na+/H+ antiporter NhaC [Thermoanaerobaculaceae bacterium]